MQHSLKSGDTKDHFRWVKVPGTASYWKAWLTMIVLWWSPFKLCLTALPIFKMT